MTIWDDIKANTWGRVVEFGAGPAQAFANANGIPQAHVNAITHAYASAYLVWYDSAVVFPDGAVQDATILGNLKEWVPHTLTLGDAHPLDTLKDQWNNEIGRQIAVYAVKYGLTQDQKAKGDASL